MKPKPRLCFLGFYLIAQTLFLLVTLFFVFILPNLEKGENSCWVNSLFLRVDFDDSCWGKSQPKPTHLDPPFLPGSQLELPIYDHPACQNEIYCTGELLHVIQTSNLFYDSKTFVDMPLKVPAEKVLKDFSQLPRPLSPEILEAFLHNHFHPAGFELEAVVPKDWREAPSFLEKVKNKEAKIWALSLHERWRQLFRRFNHSNLCRHCYSSIYLPHPFVIPGGRFREPYYWDSYWIVRGLLVSGMRESAKKTIQNLAFMVKTYGFVLNGGRIYYQNRSQPPLLTASVRYFYQETKDEKFLKEMLPILDTEYQFWMANRSIAVKDSSGTTHFLNHFNVSNDAPRPEAYIEDLILTSSLPQDQVAAVFQHMASGAESGWDFSSRWFDGEDLKSIRKTHVVPVTLNSCLYDMEKTLSRFHGAQGNLSSQRYYEAQATKRLEAMSLFWNNTEHCWKDIVYSTGKHRVGFYASTVLPLLLSAHNRGLKDLDLFVQYIARHFNYQCGIPTSDYCSGEQWDFPNSWAPLQLSIISAMELVKDRVPEAGFLATELAHQWLNCNYCGWNSTGGVNGGVMFEKYDVHRNGIPGSGGEYTVQVGFAWTNAVALELLSKYGDSFEPHPCPLRKLLVSRTTEVHTDTEAPGCADK